MKKMKRIKQVNCSLCDDSISDQPCNEVLEMWVCKNCRDVIQGYIIHDNLVLKLENHHECENCGQVFPESYMHKIADNWFCEGCNYKLRRALMK